MTELAAGPGWDWEELILESRGEELDGAFVAIVQKQMDGFCMRER